MSEQEIRADERAKVLREVATMFKKFRIAGEGQPKQVARGYSEGFVNGWQQCESHHESEFDRLAAEAEKGGE